MSVLAVVFWGALVLLMALLVRTLGATWQSGWAAGVDDGDDSIWMPPVLESDGRRAHASESSRSGTVGAGSDCSGADRLESDCRSGDSVESGCSATDSSGSDWSGADAGASCDGGGGDGGGGGGGGGGE